MSDQSRRPRRPRSSPYVLDCLNPDAAGIDCGATTHVVAVSPDRDAAPVQSFRTFTTDLHRLADWLVTCRVTSVALESTGLVRHAGSSLVNGASGHRDYGGRTDS